MQQVWKIMAYHSKCWNLWQTPEFTVSVNSWFSSLIMPSCRSYFYISLPTLLCHSPRVQNVLILIGSRHVALYKCVLIDWLILCSSAQRVYCWIVACFFLFCVLHLRFWAQEICSIVPRKSVWLTASSYYIGFRLYRSGWLFAGFSYSWCFII